MKAYALTDVGRVRQMNQDYQFASTEPVGPLSNLFIVADGMGGHRAGDFASRYLVEHLVSYIKECDDTGAVSAINNGIAKINRELYEQSLTNAELAGMGTTLVAATIEDSIPVSYTHLDVYKRQPEGPALCEPRGGQTGRCDDGRGRGIR